MGSTAGTERRTICLIRQRPTVPPLTWANASRSVHLLAGIKRRRRFGSLPTFLLLLVEHLHIHQYTRLTSTIVERAGASAARSEESGRDYRQRLSKPTLIGSSLRCAAKAHPPAGRSKGHSEEERQEVEKKKRVAWVFRPQPFLPLNALGLPSHPLGIWEKISTKTAHRGRLLPPFPPSLANPSAMASRRLALNLSKALPTRAGLSAARTLTRGLATPAAVGTTQTTTLKNGLTVRTPSPIPIPVLPFSGPFSI